MKLIFEGNVYRGMLEKSSSDKVREAVLRGLEALMPAFNVVESDNSYLVKFTTDDQNLLSNLSDWLEEELDASCSLNSKNEIEIRL